ncbi:MAG: hypothetical protein JWO02_4411 [Solirubrobacterales bacterium]|nr:hypothetical protein [Solirubrobacterales bacterium]
MDRLQRAVAGWVGPVLYVLPILEVWLLSRMSKDGADAFLVILQVLWGVCLAVAGTVCVRRARRAGSEAEPHAPDDGADPATSPSRVTPRSLPTPRRRGNH